MGRYLTIDIGLEKGRHILGRLEDGKLVMEEIHSFDNKTCEQEGGVFWDFDYLFKEVRFGLKKCFECNKLPIFVAVTAWDHDFVLLNEENKIIGDTAIRKEGADVRIMLAEIKEKHPDYYDKADSFLAIPDYFNFLLTGTKRSEYYKAVTTGLVDRTSKDWNGELLQELGLPRKIFRRINEPAAVLGTLKLEINEEIAYDCIILQSLSAAAGADLFQINEIMEECKADRDKILSVSAAANLLLHMVCSHELKDFEGARECLRKTFRRD